MTMIIIIIMFINACSLLFDPLRDSTPNEDADLLLPDADADTDVDADTDADVDADTDSDADTDIDADGDTDSDGDGDGDGDGDSDSDVDVDADSDADEEGEPSCGNGAVEPGEECDDSSAFCEGCRAVVPESWIRCDDSLGSHRFYRILSELGDIDWNTAQNACLDLLAVLGVADYAMAGLAVMEDSVFQDCVQSILVPGYEYWFGFRQRPEGIEPAEGWYWTAYDGTDYIEVSPYDPSGWMVGFLDDTGPPDIWDADCARLQTIEGWQASDWHCDYWASFDALCMVVFSEGGR